MRKGKGEMVAMNLNTVMYKHVWNVIDFSKLSAEYYFSPSFNGEDQKYCKWYRASIQVYACVYLRR